MPQIFKLIFRWPQNVGASLAWPGNPAINKSAHFAEEALRLVLRTEGIVNRFFPNFFGAPKNCAISVLAWQTGFSKKMLISLGRVCSFV